MAMGTLPLQLASTKKFQGSLTAYLRRKALRECGRTFLWKSRVRKRETWRKCDGKRITFSNSAGQSTLVPKSPGKLR